MKFESRIIKWAQQRGIFAHSDPKTQCLKTMSEAGELADAVAKGECITDHVGDIVVTLAILCKMHNTTVEYCVGVAYEEIKDRTGRMANGTFVKDS